MNATLTQCNSDLLSGFEIATGVLSLLFVVSETLGKSKCPHNSVFDLFSGLFTVCLNKNKDPQMPIGPGLESSEAV